jgi:hypothetical protein
MNPRYVIHEEIDRYLNGKMAAAERRLFEAELASNPSVRAEFEAQQIAHQVIMEDSLLDLKKQMQRDMNGGGSTPPSSGTGKSYLNLLFALGGMICVSSLYYFYSHKTAENKNAPPIQESVTIRSAPSNEENSIASGTSSKGGESTVAASESSIEVNVIAPPGITITQTPGSSSEAEQPKEVKDDKPQANPQHTTTPAASTTPHITAPAQPTPDKPAVTPGAPEPVEPAAETRTTAYTFQPEIEGNWTLPYKENTKGKFSIVSRSGVTVYQTNFSSGTTEQWNGNDAAGVAMPAGYYIYLIEYEKGGVEKGSLTILR